MKIKVSRSTANWSQYSNTNTGFQVCIPKRQSIAYSSFCKNYSFRFLFSLKFYSTCCMILTLGKNAVEEK